MFSLPLKSLGLSGWWPVDCLCQSETEGFGGGSTDGQPSGHLWCCSMWVAGVWGWGGTGGGWGRSGRCKKLPELSEQAGGMLCRITFRPVVQEKLGSFLTRYSCSAHITLPASLLSGLIPLEVMMMMMMKIMIVVVIIMTTMITIRRPAPTPHTHSWKKCFCLREPVF